MQCLILVISSFRVAMKRGREEVSSEADTANTCLMLLNKVGESAEISSLRERDQKGGAFKCKTCNRRFNSFQALGGHRASHKKPKLMVSDLSCHSHRVPGSKPRMHPCPICGLQFSIGQALGGHMRKHRVASNNDENMLNTGSKHALPILKESKDSDNNKKRLNLCLDLNLPPLEIDLKLDIRMPVLNIVSFD